MPEDPDIVILACRISCSGRGRFVVADSKLEAVASFSGRDCLRL
jgi:hypothetical protein